MYVSVDSMWISVVRVRDWYGLTIKYTNLKSCVLMMIYIHIGNGIPLPLAKTAQLSRECT